VGAGEARAAAGLRTACVDTNGTTQHRVADTPNLNPPAHAPRGGLDVVRGSPSVIRGVVACPAKRALCPLALAIFLVFAAFVVSYS
jgi:hypothetical protein